MVILALQITTGGLGFQYSLELNSPDLTPLTALQVQILELLDLSPDLYRSLAENST
jgi:hypothetical protein